MVTQEQEGTWKPEPGYIWVENGNVSRGVKWQSGWHSVDHMVTEEQERTWKPEPGYIWVENGNVSRGVKWQPGWHSVDHMVTQEQERTWKPEDGYIWVENGNVSRGVKWQPGRLSVGNPHVIASDQEGYWHPEPGYVWVAGNSPHPGDFRVQKATEAETASLAELIEPPKEAKEDAATTVQKIQRDDAERRAELVAILDRVPVDMKLSKERVAERAKEGDLYHLKCQEFFRTLGIELRRAGKRSWDKDFDESLQARGIILQIQGDTKNWWPIQGSSEEEDWQQAQDEANMGFIVVGGYIPNDPKENGHIAIVTPVPPDFDRSKLENPGQGPFVRDGNDHRSKATGK